VLATEQRKATVSNIIPFPSNTALSDERRRAEKEKIARHEKAGGLAYENLNKWLGRIPPDDRVQLGKNMNRIITEYNVKTRELQWRDDYASAQTFSVDMHRMRVRSEQVNTRNLVASPYKWLRLLGYVQNWLRINQQSVTLEHLADRLTRGTRFHPTKKELSKSEKLQILLNGWANKVNNEFNLLQTFSEISALRAEHFRRNYRDIYDPVQPEPDLPSFWTIPFSDYFEFDESVPIEVRQCPMGELASEEWETILQVLPEDRLAYFEQIRDTILEWKRPFDSRTALWRPWREVAFDHDVAVLPHWFIGFHAYSDLSSVQAVGWGSDWVNRFREKGTGDPLADGGPVDWDWECSYLVLYPEEGFTRLVPYIFRYAMEGTMFLPLGDEDLAASGDIPWIVQYFSPKPAGEVAIARTLLVRLEESLEEVLESWRSTAPSLRQHPYLSRKRQDDLAVEKAIEKLIASTD
jgi:hypothetical protein